MLDLQVLWGVVANTLWGAAEIWLQRKSLGSPPVVLDHVRCSFPGHCFHWHGNFPEEVKFFKVNFNIGISSKSPKTWSRLQPWVQVPTPEPTFQRSKSCIWLAYALHCTLLVSTCLRELAASCLSHGVNFGVLCSIYIGVLIGIHSRSEFRKMSLVIFVTRITATYSIIACHDFILWYY